MQELVERFETLGADAALYAPRLIGAAAFLFVGVLVAWLVDRVIASICRRFGLDESGAGRQLGQLFALIGLKSAPSEVLRRLIRWTVLIVAVAQAARFLELDTVATVIDRAVRIAPIFIIVLALLFLGALLSDRLARAARSAAERSGAVPPAIAGAVVRGVVLAGALALALEAAGVTADLPVIVLAICLAGALVLVVAALIVGARGLLENLLAARYVEEHYIEGQMVEFRSERAQIRSIGLLATVVRTADGTDHTTPNSMFLRGSL